MLPKLEKKSCFIKFLAQLNNICYTEILFLNYPFVKFRMIVIFLILQNFLKIKKHSYSFKILLGNLFLFIFKFVKNTYFK